MTSLRKVLIIAYYFPPMGLSGVQRTLKFVKYLPQFGWQPTVLTVTPTGYYAQDYTLLEEIHPHHIAIERVGSLDPNRLFRKKGVVKMPSERSRKILTFLSDSFFIPDNKIGWKRKATAAAKQLMEKENFDVVFSTAPPFTDHLIGAELSKASGKPLVLDYRDPWLEYPYKYYPTPFHRWRNYVLEKQVLHGASRVIATNRRVKELILQRYKFLAYQDVVILSQGFDPADFSTVVPIRPATGTIRLTHAGVFYGDRTPLYMLQALRKFLDMKPQMKHRLELCFVGNLHDQHVRLIREMGLEENAVMPGYLDHGECIRYLMGSDILWLMLNNDRQSPGKVYEYLGARKPILACVPEGFIRQTLEEAGGTTIVAPTDVDGIVAALDRYVEQYEQRALPAPREEIVKRYDRVMLTNELSKILGFLVE